MTNFDIEFGPWINYGNANKQDEIGTKMLNLVNQEWSPFNGQDMAAVFIFCMAYGFAKKRNPVSPPGTGSMPANAFDQEMRNYMKFVAIADTKNLDVILDAKKVVKICEGYAYSAFLEIYDRLEKRDSSIPPESILETLIQEVSAEHALNNQQNRIDENKK